MHRNRSGDMRAPAGATGEVQATGQVLAQLLDGDLATGGAAGGQVHGTEAADAQQRTLREAGLEIGGQPQLSAVGGLRKSRRRRGRRCGVD